MKAEIEQAHPGVEVTLVKGSRGAFEIAIDGAPVFSKKATRRFPETEAILALIAARS